MAQPLMPKATAVWLVDNTMLTFDQIAAFCGLHPLEVQAIADGDVGSGIVGSNPTSNGELTADEIKRCEGNAKLKLEMVKSDLPQPKARSKGPRYTPVAKRGEKPNAVAWLLKHQPLLTDAQIGRLIGTTKPTIQSIRDRSHLNMTNIKAEDPVLLSLCKQEELNKAVERATKKAEKEAAKKKAAEDKADKAKKTKKADKADKSVEEAVVEIATTEVADEKVVEEAEIATETTEDQQTA